EIQEKIKQLNLDNCRVLVTNVDSQSSLNGGIVVQVLGEMSNGNEETSRKFAQTFFLAEQPNGYYVLNDIFRFLNEDDDVNSECDEVDEGAIEESVGNEGGEEDRGSSPTGTLVEEPINVPTIIEEESVVTHTRETNASEVTTNAPNTNETTESVSSASLPLMSASVSEGQQTNSSLVASNDTLNASSDKSQGTQVAVGSPSVHANKIPVTNVAVNSQPVYPKASVPNVPIVMPFANQASSTYINQQQPVAAMVNGQYQNIKQTTNGQIGNASPTYAQRSNTPRPQTVGSGPAYTQTSSSRTQAAGNSPAFAQQLQTSKVASQTVPHTVNGLHMSAPRSISPVSQRSVSPVGNDHKPVQNIVNSDSGVVNQLTSLENGQPAVAKPAVNISDNSETASVKPASNVVNGENPLSKSTSNNGESAPAKSVVNDEAITHTNVQSGSDSKKIGTSTVNTTNVKDESAANAAQSSGTNQQVTQPPPKPQGPQTWASTLFKSSGSTQTESKPQSVPATLPAQKIQQKPAPQNSYPPQQQQARDNRNFRQEGPRGNNRRNNTNFSVYVKGINSKVPYEQLKSSLSTFGQIKHLDMVYNKSCAFVVFADEESYKECLNRHTLTVANQNLIFEERRPSRNVNRGGNNKPP
ncbi:15860_t:CDS:2, partial [Dentiscutata heterogama]